MFQKIKSYWEISLVVFILTYICFISKFTQEFNINDNLKVIPYNTIQHLSSNSQHDNHENHAYVQYATTFEYLNLAMINHITLRKSNTVIPTLLILYNKDLNMELPRKLGHFEKICSDWNITLTPISLISSINYESSTWKDSYTKLRIFEQLKYDKLVYFDADSMLLNVSRTDNVDDMINHNGNLDELFSLPDEFDIALPEAYWIENVVDMNYHKLMLNLKQNEQNIGNNNTSEFKFNDLPTLISSKQKFSNRLDFFASHIMVVKPSQVRFNQLYKYIDNPWYWYISHRSRLQQKQDYDMEVINKYLDDQLHDKNITVGILPHQNYGVLTGEFHEKSHWRYLLNSQYNGFGEQENINMEFEWNPKSLLKNIRVVHFSDNPLPKPWEEMADENEHEHNPFTVYCQDEIAKDDFSIQHTITYEPRVVNDCDSVYIWRWINRQFKHLKQEHWII